MAYQPRFQMNPGQYVNQDPGIQKFDFGAGFRALAEQGMRQKDLDQNQAQFMKSQAQQQSQFDTTQSFNKKRAQDENTRFSLQLEDKKEDSRLQRDEQKANQMKATLIKARQAVVSGRYEEADALLGPLAEMGVEVNKSPGKDGKPVYKFKAPTFGDQPGPVKFDDINARFSEQNQSQVPQTGTEQNPVTQQTEQPQQEMFQDTAPESLQGDDVVTRASLDRLLSIKSPLDLIQATGGNETEQAPVEQPSAQTESGFDPYSLDTAALQNQVDQRLKPWLSGLVNAMPAQMRGRVANLSVGARALGGTPEQTIEMMQKPLDSAIRAQGDVLSAEASRVRASMSNENQGANRNMRMEDRAWRKTREIGDKHKLSERVVRLRSNLETYNALDNADNATAGGVIAGIRNSVETGVMTDADYERYAKGIMSLPQTAKEFIRVGFQGNMNPDIRAGWKRFMANKMREDKEAIAAAQHQLKVMGKRAQSVEEYNEVMDYIMAAIPEELWDEEIKQEFGVPVEQKAGPVDKEGNYPAEPGKPAKKTKSANDEAEELLK